MDALGKLGYRKVTKHRYVKPLDREGSEVMIYVDSSSVNKLFLPCAGEAVSAMPLYREELEAITELLTGGEAR